MIRKFSMRFPAFTGEEKRKVYVYLPKGYQRNEQRYPVLYMFDGHNVFYDADATYGYAWHLDRYLDRHRIPLMVVAVQCHFGKNNEREMEYSPYSIDFQSNEMPGYGHETLRWFTEVLKPQIDAEYATLSDREHTFLMGSSMGGLMSVYGLIAFNDVFSRAAALSPAYFTSSKAYLKLAETAHVQPGTTLYTDYGTEDLFVKRTLPLFERINRKLVKSGVCVTSRVIDRGKHHESTWEKQLAFAIGCLLYE